MKLGLGGAGYKCVTTVAGYSCLVVSGMDSFFHFFHLSIKMSCISSCSHPHCLWNHKQRYYCTIRVYTTQDLFLHISPLILHCNDINCFFQSHQSYKLPYNYRPEAVYTPFRYTFPLIYPDVNREKSPVFYRSPNSVCLCFCIFRNLFFYGDIPVDFFHITICSRIQLYMVFNHNIFCLAVPLRHPYPSYPHPQQLPLPPHR